MHRDIPYLSLTTIFLVAAGCAAADYEAFADERDRLDCEITAVCMGEAPMCEGIEAAPKGNCIRFRSRHADDCLADMEDWLARVQDDTEQCTVFDSKACDEVTTWVNSRPGCNSVEGRPAYEAGQPLLPAVTAGDGWAPDAAFTVDAGRDGRAAGRRWLAMARHEHASIGAFSTIALQLLALGAPPELIEGAHRAALDEVGHARAALGIARALLGESVDLGPLRSPTSARATLRTVAIEALLDGCIGEGSAAARAHVAAARAREPVAAVLRTVAADETLHAALAWSTVRWALQCDPALAEELHRALDCTRASLGAPHDDRAEFAALGLLSGTEEAQIHREVVERIVAPVLDTLTRCRSERSAAAGIA
jgi:hypothetical protein